MHCLRIGAVAINQTALDWRGNRQRVLAAIAEAKAAEVGLLCLPELCLSGYGCEDAFQGMGTCEHALASLRVLLPATEGVAVCLGLPLFWRGAIYNAVAYCADGRLAALIGKRHLAGEGLHYEPRWFQPWPAGVRVDFSAGDLACPLGDCYVDHGGVRIGFEICEDAWVAQHPAARMASQSLDVVLNPSASHFAFGKHAVRERIVSEGSRAQGVTYVYANLLGNDSGRIIYEGDCLIASRGELVAMGERLSLADHRLTTAVVDVDATRRAQARSPSFVTEPTDDHARVAIGGALPTTRPEQLTLTLAPWARDQRFHKHEAFTRAVALGLIDYLRKARTRGFVISLSGGADSAAVACLVRTAWDLGRAAFGDSTWRARIGLAEDADFADWCTCVYQATAHSGETTETAARELAAALAARYHRVDVEELVQGYRGLVAGMLGRELDWERDDIPLQNIQARARAPGIWMLANCLDALLLATSNRSEAAVGYATMDGDTCGGLSPIAGIDKAFLREWLAWMEEQGPSGIGPVPELAAVNRQQPTAELRPQQAAQTDEGDLMPYPVLDAIERLAIRDQYAPADCLQLLQVRFPDLAADDLRTWTARFFRLWSRNQWKRERYAPSFHLDDANLDPKTWCRFPILSGGFEEEIAELLAGGDAQRATSKR